MGDALHAAVVVVPPDWTPEMPIGLSEATHARYFSSLEGGLRVLIYKSAPINAIIAEGEVIDHMMLRVDDWPHMQELPRTSTGQNAEYVLPLRLLYSRPTFEYIGLSTIQEWIDDPDFPNVEWMPINDDAYSEFSMWP
jgi:hypothetical protein